MVRSMADSYLCRLCSKTLTATKNLRYRSHSDGKGEACPNSSEPIPADLLPSTGPAEVPETGRDFALCGSCGRNVKLTNLGYYEDHKTTLRGEDRCPNGGVRYRPKEGPTADVPLPGESPPDKGMYRATHPKVSAQQEVDTYLKNLAGQSMEETRALLSSPESTTGPSAPAAPSGASTESSSPESASTSGSSAKSSAGSEPSGMSSSSAVSLGPFKIGPKLSETISQPWSPFLQPPEWLGTEKPEPMGDYAKEVATRIKETFYSYSNRKSLDNRSAQTTLGPSEIGTPCDRRLAMALLNVPAVNPGGDGWASFVGTCGHVGMGEVYKFADAGTGRYAVELPVRTGSDIVPRGTTDLIDRRHGDITDWKFMGAYSLKKFKLEGPSETYRIQGQVYGYAATRNGEKIKNIVIVGLPRAGASLDEMHVWTEKYDRKVAEAALDRVSRIAGEVESNGAATPMLSAKGFAPADDCKYCPFHLKNDKEMVRGCPGS